MYASHLYYYLCICSSSFRELVVKYLGDALGTKGLKLLHKWLSQSVPDQKKINKLFYIVLRNLVLARYGCTLF